MSERSKTSDSGFQIGSNGYGQVKVEVWVEMNMYCWGWSTVRSVHSGEEHDLKGSLVVIDFPDVI